jgi:hypothetical protein
VEEEKSIASVDKVIASPYGWIVKIDYYRELIDEETNAQQGISYSSSWIWIVDRMSGLFISNHNIPVFESPLELLTRKPVPMPWELVGSVHDHLYLTAVDEEGDTYYGLYSIGSKNFRRFAMRIDLDELAYTNFTISEEGIVSSLLAAKYEARFVWWRFDKVTGF